MNTIYKSISLEKCTSLEQVIELINGGEFNEGMENITFKPERIAAQYACNAAIDDVDEHCGKEDIEEQLDFLIENGVEFDYSAALNIALDLIPHFLKEL